MINLVELIDDDQEQAPCKYGNIVVHHACYCHNDNDSAPRKCHIWRNADDWNKANCDLFEPIEESKQ